MSDKKNFINLMYSISARLDDIEALLLKNEVSKTTSLILRNMLNNYKNKIDDIDELIGKYCKTEKE